MSSHQSFLPVAIRDSATALLVELCTTSSESGDTTGLRRVAERVGSELTRCGLQAEVLDELDEEHSPQPVLIARGPGAASQHLLVIGHLDTVLPAIEPTRVGDRLLGTGALDMKGGLATLVAALDLLASRGKAAPADLVLVAVPDEEVSGTISEKVVRRWSEHARAVLVIEPGEGRAEGETLVAGRRGLTEWKLEVTGRAAHSGLAYWQGRSALVAAADWCVQAQHFSRPGTGPTINVGRVVGGTADFVDGLASNHSFVGTSRQRNVVPDRAIAEGEARYLNPTDGESIMEALATLTDRVAGAHGVKAVLTPGTSVPPVDPHGPGEELARRAVTLAASRGWRLEVEEDRGGISFPNYLARGNRVAVVDGLGPVGDGMHTREEYLDLHSFERRIVLLADLLETL